MNAQAERSYRWLFWSLVLLGFLLDQGSKYGVVRWLYDEAANNSRDRSAQRDILPGAFVLTVQLTGERDPGTGLLGGARTWSGELLPHVNRGALFGLGNGDQDGRDANFLFLLVSLGAAVAILVWSTRPTAGRDPVLCLALGLILAGTLGNLFDRVVFGGVRDFLWWFWRVNWPVFNVADCCLVCGAALLLWQALGSRAPADQQDGAAGAVTLATPGCQAPLTAEGAAAPAGEEASACNP
jgi:lipoprotein signal peptidase